MRRHVRRTTRPMAVGVAAATLAALLAGCAGSSVTRGCDARVPQPQRLVAAVVRTFPHATDAFTEGLLIHDGHLYESTGMPGRSSLRVLDPQTGAEQRRALLPARVFGEGLAVGSGNRLVQLTWKGRTAFVWNPTSLKIVGRHRYRGQGWGLSTQPDGQLLMSNGSDRLTVRNPSTFAAVSTQTVRRLGGRADQLNELEVDGSVVWANRWRTNEILRIDQRCGAVTGVVDATALAQDAAAESVANGAQIDVLNGIAKYPGTDHFLLTGKYWPKFYEVQFRPA